MRVGIRAPGEDNYLADMVILYNGYKMLVERDGK